MRRVCAITHFMLSLGFCIRIASILVVGALCAQQPETPPSKTGGAALLTPPAPVPVKKPAELIQKQAPPVVNKDVAALVTPDNAFVVISISKQRAWLMFGENQIYIDTPVSTGKRTGSTPQGKFTITQKDKDHRSSVYGDFVDKRGRTVRRGVSLKVDSAPAGTRYVGAPMKFFCRLTNDGVGMHVGKLPGYPASHGCIRLPDEIAPLIYEKVKIGTPVEIRAE
jgi:lipoprotein-anchoring transpeptidase ErfK/SrfK